MKKMIIECIVSLFDRKTFNKAVLVIVALSNVWKAWIWYVLVKKINLDKNLVLILSELCNKK